jgi:hypothetical protein
MRATVTRILRACQSRHLALRATRPAVYSALAPAVSRSLYVPGLYRLYKWPVYTFVGQLQRRHVARMVQVVRVDLMAHGR